MKRTITAVGVGTITAAPDIATVDVGVQVQSANAHAVATELATATGSAAGEAAPRA
jgi:uncharacterized protein YggE